MKLFTSVKEKRLWTLIAFLIAGIYATLGLAGKIASKLEGSGSLSMLFLLAFILSILSIIGIAWKKNRWREFWIWFAMIIVFAMLFIRMGIPLAERSHLFEYGLLAALMYTALEERYHLTKSPFLVAAIAFACTALIGWIDELIQLLIPNRVYDIRDVGFNALAAFGAISAMLLLAWIKKRFSKDQTKAE